MNTIYTSSVNALYAFNFDLNDLCRICGTTSNDLNSMFDDNGSAYDFSSKINEYLPIRVRKSDYLPQKICSMCASTLLSFHQLYIVCQSTNARLLQSLDGDAYEHHVVKSNAVGDTSELLELQSSFSREIENEILNMHDSKEINEAESEIAANAAVKELERIGSAENISLVEDVAIETLNAIEEIKPDDKTASGTEVVDVIVAEPEPEPKPEKRKSTENSGAVTNKTKKEPSIKKQKPNETKSKNSAKEKTPKVAKTPKNGINKSPKEEILKENLTRPKNEKVKNGNSKTSPKRIKESTEITTPIETPKSEKICCEYCSDTFDAKPLMIDHIKDVHNDLIFHCETCGDCVARIELISHMLHHALNPNSSKKVGTTVSDTTVNRMESEENTKKLENGNSIENGDTSKSETNNVKENGQPSSPVKIRPNYCAECDKTFADSGGFKYHINSFHKKIKKYECDICGNHFSCKRVITNHLRGVHMKERIFECDQCSKKFSTDSALYMHKKIHENVFKCACLICDRRFRSKSKLKIHMTMHTKEKNYFCEICQRGFAVRNNLTKHMLTHSKSFDFKCTKCSYKANQRRYLSEHIKRAHKTAT